MEPITPDKIIAIAESRVGKTEYPPKSNNIDCNTWYYGHEVSGPNFPWCVVEQEYIFHLANASKLLKRTASSSTLASWFKQNGRFYTNSPQIGDIVFYNFDSPNYFADHVGFVMEPIKGGVMSYEGNTSFDDKGSQSNGGACAIKKRTAKIVGYGRPKYDMVPTSKSTDSISDYPTLKKGDKGPYVTLLKEHLTKMGFGNLSLENDIFTQGVGDAVQYVQVVNKLVPDRICGPKTWPVILGRKI